MTDIANLIREYFLLDDGVLIHHHEELLKLLEIDNSNENHPHCNKRVYMTRRALKHMVESRRKDLSIRHTSEDVLTVITFAALSITDVILHFDHYELEPENKHFFTKDFSSEGMPKVRVLLNNDAGNLLIKSVHFVRRTKKHHE